MHSWLASLLNRLPSDSTALAGLKNMILMRFSDLVTIDSAATHELIVRFFNKTAERSVVRYLAAYPKLQIDYLERILGERRKQDVIDNELLILYVELICKEEDEEKVRKRGRG